MTQNPETTVDKPQITITRTSYQGQSIFVLRMPGDTGHMPTVSVQLPTHVALWLKAAADARADSPKDFLVH